MDWKPTASLINLQKRANIIRTIRNFFEARGVLEVETPQLGWSTATDPHIASFFLSWSEKSGHDVYQYLQTSPEFPMKRLLAAEYGSIYQMCKVFRKGEQGRLHHPEFTLLEWYRVNWDHRQLMTEVDTLLQVILKTTAAEFTTYAQIFNQYLNINPHTSTAKELQTLAETRQLAPASTQDEDKDFWLHLLLSHCIEPFLGKERPIFVTDFPASQAALAKIRPENPPVAERFEVYYRGIELGNGYHELIDAEEQAYRFEKDNQQRISMNLPTIPLDNAFLEALKHGMPNCAGVALGLDRMVMMAVGASSIAEVLSFTDANVEH